MTSTLKDKAMEINGTLIEYISRQNVIVMALNQLCQDTKVTKFTTLDELNKSHRETVLILSSIYHVAIDNVKQQKQYSNFNGLEAYAHTNTVALMAMQNTVTREKDAKAHTNYEDGMMGYKLLLSDINDMADMISNNMEALWSIKDKGSN